MRRPALAYEKANMPSNYHIMSPFKTGWKYEKFIKLSLMSDVVS